MRVTTAAGSSLRKRLRNPPRFFSAAASADGAVHSPPRGPAGAAGDSGERADPLDQGSDAAGAWRGAVGAPAFEGASVDAGEGVIHEAVDDGDGAGCGAPPRSARAPGGAGPAGGAGGRAGGAVAPGAGGEKPGHRRN